MTMVVVIIVMVGFILFPFFTIYFSNKENTVKAQQVVQADEVKMLDSAYGYEGEFYESVVASLKAMGFTDIETIPMGDITYERDSDLDTIESVSIGGNFKFTKNDIFKK